MADKSTNYRRKLKFVSVKDFVFFSFENNPILIIVFFNPEFFICCK
jgi:hypothetical protein